MIKKIGYLRSSITQEVAYLPCNVEPRADVSETSRMELIPGDAWFVELLLLSARGCEKISEEALRLGRGRHPQSPD